MRPLVNNDFHQPRTIFEVLRGLTVPGLTETPGASEAQANGTH